MQTTCARKHNKPSQDICLAATPTGAFSLTNRQDGPWNTRRPSQPKKNIIINQINQNHRKIMKLLQFEKF